MQTCQMEQKMETFLETINAPTGQSVQSNSLPKFEESILSTSEGGVLPLAIGLATSGFFGGLINNFFPLGNLALPVAGYLMMRFFKGGFLHGMGKGVLAAGIAALFGGLGGGLGNILGNLGGGGNQQSQSMAITDNAGNAIPVSW